MSDIPWELRRRALKDSLRHDKRVKEAIRKNLRELIAEETIITSDGQKRVKIPLRYLDQYRFRYGQRGVGRDRGRATWVMSLRARATAVTAASSREINQASRSMRSRCRSKS